MVKTLHWLILTFLLALISGCKLESQFDPWFQPGSSATDNVSPILGDSILFADVTENSLQVSWGSASDNITQTSGLRYKLVKATHLSALDTINKADSISGENLVMDWTPNINSQIVTGLNEGTTYYFAVLVRDIAKNKALYAPASQTTLDVTAPAVGTGIVFFNLSGNSLTVSWGAASDNVSASVDLQYKVVMASTGAAIDSVAEVDQVSGNNLIQDWAANLISQNVTGLTEGTTYYFAVLVKDPSGNKSLYSPSSTTTLDVTAPAVGTGIVFFNLSGNSLTVSWGAASDNVSASVDLQYKVVMASTGAAIDSVAEVDQVSGNNLIQDWAANLISQNVTGLTEGTTYYFAVLVKDLSGNKSLYSPNGQMTLDTSAPAPGYFLASTDVTATSFNLNWTKATDNLTSVDNLQYLVCSSTNLLDLLTVEGCLSAQIEQDWTPDISFLTLSGKSYGTAYQFNILVKDSAGNIRSYEGKTQGTSGVFMSRWNTGNIGTSGDGQIKLPLEIGGNYNFVVDWGDGSIDTITSWDSPAATHSYPVSGSWVIGISGTIEGFRFNNEGDRVKLLEVQQWGPLRLGNSGGYFYGAVLLQITATDNLDFSGTTDLSFAFANCSTLTTIPNLENWDVSNVTNMQSLFQNAVSFNQDLSAWNISNVTNMTDMLSSVTLSNENYEALLVSWSALSVQPNIVFDAGNAVYTSEAATLARNILSEAPNNWTIHDGVSVGK
jgi:surface protein